MIMCEYFFFFFFLAKAKYAIPNGNTRCGRWGGWNFKVSLQVDGDCQYEENEWWKIVVAREEAMFLSGKRNRCFFRVFQAPYLGNGNDDWYEICAP